MSSNKEPVYWNNAEFDNLNDEAKIKYSNIFKDKTKKIIGESTTSYMFYDSFIERINKIYDKPPKLIFVLRNPIDRFNSHYWWMKGLGLEKDNFYNAINSDLNFFKDKTSPQNSTDVGSTPIRYSGVDPTSIRHQH